MDNVMEIVGTTLEALPCIWFAGELHDLYSDILLIDLCKRGQLVNAKLITFRGATMLF